MKTWIRLLAALAAIALLSANGSALAGKNKGLEAKFKTMISKHCFTTRHRGQMLVSRSSKPKVEHVTIYRIMRDKSGWYHVELSMYGVRDYLFWNPRLRKGVCGRKNFKKLLRKRRRS